MTTYGIYQNTVYETYYSRPDRPRGSLYHFSTSCRRSQTRGPWWAARRSVRWAFARWANGGVTRDRIRETYLI